MSVTVEQVKCACPDCVCIVGVKRGIEREGRIYCDEACASHHKDEVGCHHAGCPCRG